VTHKIVLAVPHVEQFAVAADEQLLFNVKQFPVEHARHVQMFELEKLLQFVTGAVAEQRVPERAYPILQAVHFVVVVHVMQFKLVAVAHVPEFVMQYVAAHVAHVTVNEPVPQAAKPEAMQ